MTARIIGIACIALLAIFAATPASAALFAYEGFDYTAGNLAGGNGGSGWGGAWTIVSGDNGGTQVTSGSLTSAASPFASVGNKIQGVDAGWDFISRQLAADSIDMDTDASLYTSFLLRLDMDKPLGTPGILNKFTDAAVTFPDIGWVGSTGHQEKTALASDISGAELTAGTTYFVVAKLTGTVDPANDFFLANFYLPTDTVPAIEPDPLDPLAWDVIKNGEDRTGVVRTIVAGLLHSGGNMDELRYGETWEDVALFRSEAGVGDFNSDGVVDAADYTVWRDGDSPDSATAGYALWVANFGQSTASGSAADHVPEPTTLLLALLALTAAPLRVRHG